MRHIVSNPMGRSIWSETATSTIPVDRIAPAEMADLCIIGGGFLGLSTALHAARAGLGVRVVEAGEIGGCASGLNGGQVIPGLKLDPDELLAAFGPERGGAMLDFAARTADAVFDLIAAEKLAVPHQRTGWIQAAHISAAAAQVQARAAQWAARGADVAALDAAGIAALTGTDGYVGGWIDRRAGTVDPLALTRELARLAAGAGARLATGIRAIALRPQGAGWQVETTAGTITASRVVVATNAYADDLIPGLRQTLVTLHSFQIATAPLPPDLAAAILPQGQAVSDSRRILNYYRKTADGRFMLGGRGTMAVPTRPQAWGHLEHSMRRLFPALAGIPVTHRWFGRVAVTLDHLPHLHAPAPGLMAMGGCQGRGVGMQTALGRHLAAWAMRGDTTGLPLPVTAIRPIPFHRFRRIGVGAMIAWYRFLDGLDGGRA